MEWTRARPTSPVGLPKTEGHADFTNVVFEDPLARELQDLHEDVEQALPFYTEVVDVDPSKQDRSQRKRIAEVKSNVNRICGVILEQRRLIENEDATVMDPETRRENERQNDFLRKGAAIVETLQGIVPQTRGLELKKTLAVVGAAKQTLEVLAKKSAILPSPVGEKRNRMDVKSAVIEKPQSGPVLQTTPREQALQKETKLFDVATTNVAQLQPTSSSSQLASVPQFETVASVQAAWKAAQDAEASTQQAEMVRSVRFNTKSTASKGSNVSLKSLSKESSDDPGKNRKKRDKAKRKDQERTSHEAVIRKLYGNKNPYSRIVLAKTDSAAKYDVKSLKTNIAAKPVFPNTKPSSRYGVLSKKSVRRDYRTKPADTSAVPATCHTYVTDVVESALSNNGALAGQPGVVSHGQTAVTSSVAPCGRVPVPFCYNDGLPHNDSMLGEDVTQQQRESSVTPHRDTSATRHQPRDSSGARYVQQKKSEGSNAISSNSIRPSLSGAVNPSSVAKPSVPSVGNTVAKPSYTDTATNSDHLIAQKPRPSDISSKISDRKIKREVQLRETAKRFDAVLSAKMGGPLGGIEYVKQSQPVTLPLKTTIQPRMAEYYRRAKSSERTRIDNSILQKQQPIPEEGRLGEQSTISDQPMSISQNEVLTCLNNQPIDGVTNSEHFNAANDVINNKNDVAEKPVNTCGVLQPNMLFVQEPFHSSEVKVAAGARTSDLHTTNKGAPQGPLSTGQSGTDSLSGAAMLTNWVLDTLNSIKRKETPGGPDTGCEDRKSTAETSKSNGDDTQSGIFSDGLSRSVRPSAALQSRCFAAVQTTRCATEQSRISGPAQSRPSAAESRAFAALNKPSNPHRQFQTAMEPINKREFMTAMEPEDRREFKTVTESSDRFKTVTELNDGFKTVMESIDERDFRPVMEPSNTNGNEVYPLEERNDVEGKVWIPAESPDSKGESVSVQADLIRKHLSLLTEPQQELYLKILRSGPSVRAANVIAAEKIAKKYASTSRLMVQDQSPVKQEQVQTQIPSQPGNNGTSTMQSAFFCATNHGLDENTFHAGLIRPTVVPESAGGPATVPSANVPSQYNVDTEIAQYYQAGGFVTGVNAVGANTISADVSLTGVNTMDDDRRAVQQTLTTQQPVSQADVDSIGKAKIIMEDIARRKLQSSGGRNMLVGDNHSRNSALGVIPENPCQSTDLFQHYLSGAMARTGQQQGWNNSLTTTSGAHAARESRSSSPKVISRKNSEGKIRNMFAPRESSSTRFGSPRHVTASLEGRPNSSPKNITNKVQVRDNAQLQDVLQQILQAGVGASLNVQITSEDGTSLNVTSGVVPTQAAGNPTSAGPKGLPLVEANGEQSGHVNCMAAVSNDTGAINYINTIGNSVRNPTTTQQQQCTELFSIEDTAPSLPAAPMSFSTGSRYGTSAIPSATYGFREGLNRSMSPLESFRESRSSARNLGKPPLGNSPAKAAGGSPVTLVEPPLVQKESSRSFRNPTQSSSAKAAQAQTTRKRSSSVRSSGSSPGKPSSARSSIPSGNLFEPQPRSGTAARGISLDRRGSLRGRSFTPKERVFKNETSFTPERKSRSGRPRSNTPYQTNAGSSITDILEGTPRASGRIISVEDEWFRKHDQPYEANNVNLVVSNSSQRQEEEKVNQHVFSAFNSLSTFLNYQQKLLATKHKVDKNTQDVYEALTKIDDSVKRRMVPFYPRVWEDLARQQQQGPGSRYEVPSPKQASETLATDWTRDYGRNGPVGAGLGPKNSFLQPRDPLVNTSTWNLPSSSLSDPLALSLFNGGLLKTNVGMGIAPVGEKTVSLENVSLSLAKGEGLKSEFKSDFRDALINGMSPGYPKSEFLTKLPTSGFYETDRSKSIERSSLGLSLGTDGALQPIHTQTLSRAKTPDNASRVQLVNNALQRNENFLFYPEMQSRSTSKTTECSGILDRIHFRGNSKDSINTCMVRNDSTNSNNTCLARNDSKSSVVTQTVHNPSADSEAGKANDNEKRAALPSNVVIHIHQGTGKEDHSTRVDTNTRVDTRKNVMTQSKGRTLSQNKCTELSYEPSCTPSDEVVSAAGVSAAGGANAHARLPSKTLSSFETIHETAVDNSDTVEIDTANYSIVRNDMSNRNAAVHDAIQFPSDHKVPECVRQFRERRKRQQRNASLQREFLRFRNDMEAIL